MQLLKNILYNILYFQEQFLRMRLSKTIGIKNTSKKKRHYASGCTLDLSIMAETEKHQLEIEINTILQKYNYEPKEILKYINEQGTTVVYINNAAKYLNPIGENEGFIIPTRGAKALYFSILAKLKPSFKTKEMFILSNGEINKYYFIYHFYNWYAFKHNISGLDAESQYLLKKYLYTNADTKQLQLADIYKLKDAIKQDKASIEFVIKLCRNYEGAKHALHKLKDEGGANL